MQDYFTELGITQFVSRDTIDNDIAKASQSENISNNESVAISKIISKNMPNISINKKGYFDLLITLNKPKDISLEILLNKIADSLKIINKSLIYKIVYTQDLRDYLESDCFLAPNKIIKFGEVSNVDNNLLVDLNSICKKVLVAAELSEIATNKNVKQELWNKLQNFVI